MSQSHSLDHGVPLAVAEIQGLYGPFLFPESLLQKLWLRGDFDPSSARLHDGASIKVLYPGKWNLLGGPDFKGARLAINGVDRTGDVELHLEARDWAAHGHATDPAYDAVIIHVVLFPPPPGFVTVGAGQRTIPTLVLLPLLFHDLEEYAASAAIEALANRDRTAAIEQLHALRASELTELIRFHARRRWEAKIHFAGLRITRLGWESACHQTALEILGYRFNRVPMLRVAGQYPLGTWREHPSTAIEALESEEAGWSLQGVRPANYPRPRLQQYAQWVKSRSDWPAKLLQFLHRLPGDRTDQLAGARAYRQSVGGPVLRAEFCREVCGEAVTGTRFDNLVCDGFLPLLVAQSREPLFDLWYYWYIGDQPPQLAKALRALGLSGTPTASACHGTAQGLLGWLLEKEAQAANAGPDAASPGRGA